MQIFVTSPDPTACARYLDDARVVKMCTETTQILSTVAHLRGIPGPYRLTHQHHPCVRWAVASPDNARWLYWHLDALLAEYTVRFGRIHKCADYLPFMRELVQADQAYTVQTFANCAGDFTHVEDVPAAYRLYLNERWRTAKRPVRFNRAIKQVEL